MKQLITKVTKTSNTSVFVQTFGIDLYNEQEFHGRQCDACRGNITRPLQKQITLLSSS